MRLPNGIKNSMKKWARNPTKPAIQSLHTRFEIVLWRFIKIWWLQTNKIIALVHFVVAVSATMYRLSFKTPLAGSIIWKSAQNHSAIQITVYGLIITWNRDIHSVLRSWYLSDWTSWSFSLGRMFPLSLCVVNLRFFSLANSCISGGTTQQEAKFSWKYWCH